MNVNYLANIGATMEILGQLLFVMGAFSVVKSGYPAQLRKFYLKMILPMDMNQSCLEKYILGVLCVPTLLESGHV